MNFGNPQRPEIMGQFVGCIEGMAEACRALDFPIVSGNVSLYNETKAEDGSGSAILPTPAIGGVGLIEDWEKAATIALQGRRRRRSSLIGERQRPSRPVALASRDAMAARTARRRRSTWPPSARPASSSAPLIPAGHVTAVHDCSDGGAAIALAEMALAGGIGARVTIPTTAPLAPILFGEDQGRYFVTTNFPDAVVALAQASGVFAAPIGTTTGDAIVIEHRTQSSVSLADLRRAHEGFLPDLMGADAAFA